MLTSRGHGFYFCYDLQVHVKFPQLYTSLQPFSSPASSRTVQDSLQLMKQENQVSLDRGKRKPHFNPRWEAETRTHMCIQDALTIQAALASSHPQASRKSLIVLPPPGEAGSGTVVARSGAGGEDGGRCS
ncbi:unnamed protein product [Amoebophrya sp. A120]|nr:unnamed protein product [Amoebophrya sp. A120]|eukprot:GSA120T00024425001.1